MTGQYKFIDHPADTGIEVWADTCPELFEFAAKGMMATGIMKPELIRDMERREIKVVGEDLKELMVNFLSEFLYFIDSESLVFSKIKLLELNKNGGYSITANAWGEKFDIERHGSVTDIKAITYHQMEIGEEEGRWHARIIFDI